jgi:hypothetical protein
MNQKISDKTLHHLKFSKTAGGLVGCKVKATENDKNQAWITVGGKKGWY